MSVSDDETAKLGALGALTGCLAIPVILPIVALVGWWIFTSLPAPFGWERGPFLLAIELGRVVVSEQATAGVREGCGFAVIELTNDEAAEITRGGLGYLSPMRRGRDGEALEAWRETPIAVRASPGDPTRFEQITASGGPMYAGMSWSCTDADAPDQFEEAQRAVEGPGAYYTSFNGGEGLIYLIPEQRLAVYLYFG
ncbi:hypothetical protein U91I_00902 [alpha proteobacterium U9-1i]|nr:hypothetical protein U91I_00902 [alpha proteobacterium U9-1i]